MNGFDGMDVVILVYFNLSHYSIIPIFYFFTGPLSGVDDMNA
jgi:hypothetical protein